MLSFEIQQRSPVAVFSETKPVLDDRGRVMLRSPSKVRSMPMR